jgi:hypothetical protein
MVLVRHFHQHRTDRRRHRHDTPSQTTASKATPMSQHWPSLHIMETDDGVRLDHYDRAGEGFLIPDAEWRDIVYSWADHYRSIPNAPTEPQSQPG